MIQFEYMADSGPSEVEKTPQSSRQSEIFISDEGVKLVEEYKHLFEPFIKRQSFKDFVGVPPLETVTSSVKSYIERASSQLDFLDYVRQAAEKGEKYTQEDFYAVEDQVLNGVLGSSEAPEIRMLILGLKPAVQSNIGGEFREKMRIRAPNINVEEIYPLALTHGVGDIRITSINYGTQDKPRLYDVAYSPKSVGKVMDEYKDVFSAYGYSDSSDETIKRAFKDNNSLIRSLLLGYSLGSSILEDTEFENLSKLPLTNEQGECLKKVLASEKVRESISEHRNIYASGDENQNLRDLWIESGLDSFLDSISQKYAKTLGISPEEIRYDWL